jgi:hypothetical protein
VYKKNLNDKEFQKTLKKRLKLDGRVEEINKRELGLDTLFMPTRGRGYKINHERNEEEIKKIKEYYM